METKKNSAKPRENSKSESISKGEEELECAVCLQTCIHPVLLPCSHIFCFLCVKGIANQSKRCAMCRQEIPADFLDNPELLKKIEEKEVDSEGYQWFYEGRNGWWQYDERTSTDLENAFSRGQRVFDVLVAGFLYSVDFDRMVQQRRNDPSRRRRIKRDLASIPKKGVAGLKTDIESSVQEECSSQSSNLNVQLPQEGEDAEITSPEPPSHSRDPTLNPTTLPAPTSELENLHLLHSDLHRNLLSDIRIVPTVMRTTENIPGSLSGIDSPHRLPVTRESTQYSTYTRLQHLFNDGNSCRSGGNNSGQRTTSNVPVVETAISRDGTRENIDNVTTQVRVFTLDGENEYYSLDDTEEYDLPNDNEDL